MNKNLWAMLQPFPKQEEPFSLMRPVASNAPTMPQGVPEGARQLAAMDQPQQMPMAQPREKVPSYGAHFDDEFKATMEQRNRALNQLKQQFADSKENAPQGLEALDLRPFMQMSDFLTDRKDSYAYQGNQAVKDHKANLSKLQESIEKQGNQLSDDQLGYLKVKMMEESANKRDEAAAKRMTSAFDRQALNNEFKLRGEWDSDEITKNTKAISEGFEKIKQSYGTDNTAKDLSLIYGIMRLQDPGSVVRESEADMAAKIGGFPQQTRAWFSQLQGDGKLSQKQRDAIRAEAETLYRAQMTRQKMVNDKYKSMASEYGFNPKRVVLDDIFSKVESGPKVGEVVDGHAFLGGDPSNPASWKAVR